jgi:transposase InsO family protein
VQWDASAGRTGPGAFVSDVFRSLLSQWDVRQRFGAVGKQSSIAVAERAILTLKQEWLRRVPVIRGLDHLADLLVDFELYCNHYRGHMALGGAVPETVHRGECWHKPALTAKCVSGIIECRLFPDTRTTAYRLAA